MQDITVCNHDEIDTGYFKGTEDEVKKKCIELKTKKAPKHIQPEISEFSRF